MRDSVRKALANKRRQGPVYTPPTDVGGTRLLRSDAKGTRKMRTRVIEDEFGHLPIR